MPQENAPSHDRSGHNASEGSPIVGCILHGRFLVEEDLSDVSLGGNFAVFAVKDLKKYCRESLLKVSPPPPDGVDADGPTLTEVCETLRRLSHPQIEEILETGCFPDGRHYVLTEPSTAASLDQLLAPDRRLEKSGIAETVEQVANAVGAAHAKGILHCDLQPSNILVPDGDIGANPITVINFGVGWPIDARGEGLSRVRPGAETLYYAAPEMLVTLGHRSQASDVYSLAVLAYRLVTGSVPFVGTGREDLLRAINAADPLLLAEKRTDLPHQAATLIMSGLEFEPASRPRNILEFGRSVASFLDLPSPISVQPVEPAAVAGPDPASVDVPAIVLTEPEFEPEAGRPFADVGPVPSVAKPAVASALSGRTVSWALILLLMAGALSIPIGQWMLNDETKAAPVGTVEIGHPTNKPVYRLRYLLGSNGAVASSFNGRAADKAQDRLAFWADATGETYILTEFTGDDGRPAYRLVYPGKVSPEATEPSPTGQRFATMTLPPGTRGGAFIWIVWMPVVDKDLSSIFASLQDGGMIVNSDDRRRVRHFLERNRGVRITESRDPLTGQTVLEGSGERIVFRIDVNESLPPTEGIDEERRAALQ